MQSYKLVSWWLSKDNQDSYNLDCNERYKLKANHKKSHKVKVTQASSQRKWQKPSGS